VLNKIKQHDAVKNLGPGLITGAADDDPSGIATYSQAGAQFGFNMLWTMVFTYPLMVGIQLISARIGHLTGKGLAANIRAAFPRPVLWTIITLLVVANTINIAADIAAMGEALRLITGGSEHIHAVVFGFVSLVLQIFIPYERYVRFLKWLTLALLAYVGVVFTVAIPWREVALGTFFPTLTLNSAMITMIVAIFGTTISPYLFFWQATQEAQDASSTRQNATTAQPSGEESRGHLRRIKWDTYIGMGFSNLVAYFIILSTAATLHTAGINEIETASQAAEALRPLAGELTFVLFSAGIIGTGMLAVPVLAGSAAYAVAEAFDWKTGLDRQLFEAKEFYALVTFATMGGVMLNFSGIDPIKALLWSAVINGLIAVPIMVIMMLLAQRRDVMGEFVVSPRLRALGWLATAVMALAVVAMLITF
jgi:NRAMP (natural resistance-associated macrophage protein)-like metal ion transporter